MKTLFNKKGKAVTFDHDIDANEALARGILFPRPPGAKKEIPKDQIVSYEDMTKEQLVEEALNKHKATLDINMKHSILVEQLEELDKKKAEASGKKEDKKGDKK